MLLGVNLIDKFLFISGIIISYFSPEVNLLAPRRVLGLIQVGVASLYKKARKLVLIGKRLACGELCGRRKLKY